MLKNKEPKPSIVSQQRVVYEFKCGLCDAGYIGYTMRHLHERCDEHKLPSSSVSKHLKNEHGLILYDMLLIREKSLSLNVQSDSIKAKLFT